MSSTALNGASKHKRSSHSKDEFCSVTVRKEEDIDRPGMELKQDSCGRVRVADIDPDGLFGDDEIEVGDIILSINGKRLQPGEGVDAFTKTILKAKTKVTVVFKKASMVPSVAEPSQLDPVFAQDNNQRGKDIFASAISRYNADGSMDVTGGSNSDMEEASAEVVTIGANKQSSDEDAGLAFQARDNKLFVASISDESVFLETDLQVGDRVLSICDMNMRNFADVKYAMSIVKKANEVVTLIVEKGGQGLSLHDNEGGDYTNEMTKGTEVHEDSSTASCSSFENESDASTKDGIDRSIRDFVIAVPKQSSKQDIGLKFRQKKNSLIVASIERDSMFETTSLQIGDRVLVINDVSFREKADKNKALLACQKTRESVSLLVQKRSSDISQ